MVELQGPGCADGRLHTQRDGTAAEIGDDVDERDAPRVHRPRHRRRRHVRPAVADGVKVEQRPVTGDDFTTTFDRDPTGDLARYRVQLINDINQPIVVTSHIYAKGAPARDGLRLPLDRSARRGAVLLGLAVLLWRRRRRAT